MSEWRTFNYQEDRAQWSLQLPMVQIDLIFPVSLHHRDVLVEPFLGLGVNKLNSLAIISQSLDQFQTLHLRHPLQMNKKNIFLFPDILLVLVYHRPDFLSPLAAFS